MTSEIELSDWIKNQVSQMLMLSIDDIKLDSDLYELGIDSQDALTLTSELDKKMSAKFSPRLVDENRTINKIIDQINSLTAVET